MKMCWTACAVGDDDDTPRSTIKHYEDVLDRMHSGDDDDTSAQVHDQAL